MLAYTRTAVLIFGIVLSGRADATETYIVNVEKPTPNKVSTQAATKADHPGFFYVRGQAGPGVRVEVQIGYYTVNPDFEHCGSKSYGWPKPVRLYHRMVYRSANGDYGVLLSRLYENADDPKSGLCTWRMSDVVVRAYRDSYSDLLAVVVLNLSGRAAYVTDPRPVPEIISLTCNQIAAPLSNWKPRCQYAPVGSAETHFILNNQHSALERTTEGFYVVSKPIQVDFRLND